jgi:hypothetical protein
MKALIPRLYVPVDADHAQLTRLAVAFGKANPAEVVLKQAKDVLSSKAHEQDFHLQRAVVLAVEAQGHQCEFFKDILTSPDTRFHGIGQFATLDNARNEERRASRLIFCFVIRVPNSR